MPFGKDKFPARRPFVRTRQQSGKYAVKRRLIMPGNAAPGKRYSSGTNPSVAVCPVPGDTSVMYSDKVLDHFQNPRNAGTLDAATATISVENPVCGDILELSVRMDEGQIAEARFRTRGCV